MALMSTMGPMGIALGVAIDEGIAKDLREAASKSGFEIKEVVSQAVDQSSQGQWVAIYGSEKSVELELRIKKYGFKTTGGADDATSAEVELELLSNDEVVATVHYPNDFESNETLIESYPLGVLKTDGVKTKALLEKAFGEVLTRLFK
jgi:hypothetical protein